jgi:hypothetical protein
LELQGYLDRLHAQTDHGTTRRGPITEVQLNGADVFWLAQHLGQGDFLHTPNLHLEGASLVEAHLEGTGLGLTRLEGANLLQAHLEGADLQGARLPGKTMAGEDLHRIRQWTRGYGGLNGFPEQLPPADLRLAFLDEATTLNSICFGDAKFGYVRVADVRRGWG